MAFLAVSGAMSADALNLPESATPAPVGVRRDWSSLATTIALALVLIFAPISFASLELSDHDAARIVQFALLTAGLVALILGVVRTEAAQTFSPQAARFLGIGVLLAAPSILHADLLRYAALEAGIFVALCLLALAVAAASRMHGPGRWLVV